MRKNKIIYSLSTRGLYSELFNLCLAMVYARQKNLHIELNTYLWNSRFKSGWIDYFESSWPFRLFGVMPWDIDNALEHAGVSFICSSDSSIVENCKDGGVVIVTYWNKTITSTVSVSNFGTPVTGSVPWIFKGAHTIAITYRDNKYWIYNAWNGATEALPYNSINYCTTGGAFIYGYYIAP